MNDLFNTSGATVSEDGLYRYHLYRVWDESLPMMVWVMQNPSTANEMDNDPTIRRCIAFANRERCGGISVRNVFALRATDELELLKHPDPVGPENLGHLAGMRADHKTIVVAAWGNRLGGAKFRAHYSAHYSAAAMTCVMLGAKCLGVTSSGEPRHPLFVRGDEKLVPWTQPMYRREEASS